MTSTRRLHQVLLTLWDIARDNPNYDRRLWGELQWCLSSLETRNNLLSALLADLLQCTDDAGNVLWEQASIHSPPQGFAVKFMREELERDCRPRIPRPPQVIPTGPQGEALDPVVDLDAVEPPPTNIRTDVVARENDSCRGVMRRPNDLPIGLDNEYDGDDESDEEDLLAFEIGLTESDDTTG